MKISSDKQTAELAVLPHACTRVSNICLSFDKQRGLSDKVYRVFQNTVCLAYMFACVYMHVTCGQTVCTCFHMYVTELCEFLDVGHIWCTFITQLFHSYGNYYYIYAHIMTLPALCPYSVEECSSTYGTSGHQCALDMVGSQMCVLCTWSFWSAMDLCSYPLERPELIG